MVTYYITIIISRNMVHTFFFSKNIHTNKSLAWATPGGF